MAFTKKQKQEMVAQYTQWLNDSQAVFLLEFNRMRMKEIDGLRIKAREAGGQMHVCKNTLLKLALKEAGITLAEPLVDSSLVGFAFQDPPGLAKVLNEACKSDVFAIKGGFLDRKQITIGQVKALAELPPMPVMRAMLLGVMLAPATKLVRTLAEPARQVAAVLKAFSEAETSPETVSSPA